MLLVDVSLSDDTCRATPHINLSELTLCASITIDEDRADLGLKGLGLLELCENAL